MNNKPDKRTFLYTALLVIAGIIVNKAGTALAGALNSSMFFDSLGTILTAALAGYLPGIVVGFLTNVLNGLTDLTSYYYSSLNTLIAITAAFFSQRKMLKRLPHLLSAVFTFAAIGGVLGGVLTFFLYPEPGAQFWPQIFSATVVDLEDKAITVIIAAIVLRLLPQKVYDRFNIAGWRDEPEKRRSEARVQGSLNLRVAFVISAATITVAASISAICIKEYHDSLIEEKSTLATNVATLAGTYIDPERVSEYIELGSEAEGYAQAEEQLQRLRDYSDGVEYLYAYRILPDGCHVVFDTDTPDTPGGEPGDLVPFDESFAEYIPALLAGEPIDPIVTNDTYGWLLTAYVPVYDAAGACQCYVAVDLMMEHLMAEEQNFITGLVSLFLGFYVLILAVGLYVSKYRLVKPINDLAAAASAFAFNSEAARGDTMETLAKLDIRTGDEIENLYHAMVKTAEDTAHYIKDSQEKASAITKLQNGLIVVMADLVESRDKCTGDHVKNTSAYVRIIMEQMRAEGMHSEELTDQYIEDVVNSAPLHDIGKIKVPDVILNKPGKLTEEEFAQMKLHAPEGGQIIAEAIEKLGGVNSGYLHEAQNLAMSHHEKWNGTGYPNRLRGEEIPLSARIMAVADVFDALVSRRSYKESMPFDKAMSIIKEGSGTHFDPQIVKAFVDAEDRVRNYLNTGKLEPDAL